MEIRNRNLALQLTSSTSWIISYLLIGKILSLHYLLIANIIQCDYAMFFVLNFICFFICIQKSQRLIWFINIYSTFLFESLVIRRIKFKRMGSYRNLFHPASYANAFYNSGTLSEVMFSYSFIVLPGIWYW